MECAAAGLAKRKQQGTDDVLSVPKSNSVLLYQHKIDVPFLNLLGQPAKSGHDGLKIYHVF